MADGRPSERGIIEIADDVGNVISGVNRLRLGPGMTMTHNPADPSIAIDATGGIISTLLSLINVDTVAALRATSALVMTVAKVAETSGYAAVGDGGSGVYDWIPSNTDADDGALTIKVTAVTTGRWKFRMPDDRIFPLAACSIDKTGDVAVGAALTALAKTLYGNGYYGIRGNSSIQINTTGSAYDLPRRVEGYPWRHYGIFFRGTSAATNFTTVITANLTVEDGITGADPAPPASPILPGPIVYGPRTCTQTIYAGDNTFTGVTDIRNLAVGNSVLVRVGADPTDAYGTAYSCYFAKILSITPTTGNAGTIVLDRRCIETPLNPLPSYNLNFNRFANKHDILKITGFQDNVLFEDCKFNDILVGGQFARNYIVNRPTSDSTADAFNFFGCEGISILKPYYKKVQGLNTDDGNPTSDPFANYGGWITVNSCRDTVVDDLKIDKFSASGGICGEELNCRNTHFTGKTRVNYDTGPSPTPLLVNNSFSSTPNSPPSILIDDFASEGGGLIPPSFNARFSSLRLGTTNAYSTSYYTAYQQQFAISAGQVLDVLYFRGKEYRHKKRCSVLCSRIPVNGTKTFPIPVNGILRICRVKATTVTGITDFKITGPDGTSPGQNDAANLSATNWVDLRGPTLMADGYQNFVSDVQWVSITTDGTFNANTYVFVDLEIWQPGGTLDGNFSITDASKVHKYSVSGAPSANADFLGQEVLGDSGTAWYKAINIGTGASDWVKINGSGDMLKSDNLSGLANVATARTNLGLGSAALAPSTAFDGAGTAESERNLILSMVSSRIERATVSGASTWTSDTFAAGTYERIVVRFRGTHAGGLRMRIGSDVSSNYTWASQMLTGTIASPNFSPDCFDGDTAFVIGRSDSGTSKVEVCIEMDVFVDGNERVGIAKYVAFGTAADDFRTQFNGLRWKNTSHDPTSITILPDTGTMTGVFEVWVLPI